MDKPIIFEMDSKTKLVYLKEEIRIARIEMLNLKHKKKLKMPTFIIHKKVVVKFD